MVVFGLTPRVLEPVDTKLVELREGDAFLDQIAVVMEKCWAQDFHERPTASTACGMLLDIVYSDEGSKCDKDIPRGTVGKVAEVLVETFHAAEVIPAVQVQQGDHQGDG